MMAENDTPKPVTFLRRSGDKLVGVDPNGKKVEDAAPKGDKKAATGTTNAPPDIRGNVIVGGGTEGITSNPPGEIPADFPGREDLVKAGFKTPEAVRALTKPQLEAVHGIGPATAEKIIAWQWE
jgi:Helix-hairpin-helix domain